MEEKEEREFEVEAILGHEERNGVILFHIRWRGYGPEDDTLEPIENLDGCELLLSQYLANAHLNNPSIVIRSSRNEKELKGGLTETIKDAKNA